MSGADLASWTAIALSGLGMIGAIWAYVRWQIDLARKDALTEIAKVRLEAGRQIETLHKRASHAERELAATRLDIAEKYVTANTLREIEDRFARGFDRLGDRLDRMFHQIFEDRERTER